ncbi:RNase H1/viroplasmin domain-containing protein [Aspergillus homomorphus CBS 101889]|uniref:Ribonuclease H1 N-terminal domain-containing protein n=1 Tax=Aspergillus homomorphus (strain CBS 101889) TaxID=1450537 RepID=A0A395HZM3_ASPHC|nr:hypothetical protein BO97DRAFT_442717 [Aspergillus homomorphus CBS 101889]RAL12833.1 hypothetical protein BO97DRAFT_442717 [Aspergillus homomorphus CBS 101889]
MPSQRYYAVVQGRSPAPGIFLTWDETKSLVNGYPGAKHQSFSTLDKAIEFLVENSVPEE